MARVLFTWELGGGLGHLVPIRRLSAALRARGHEVFAALRDVSRVSSWFEKFGIVVLQAPIRTHSFIPRYKAPATFSQILHNEAFSDVLDLKSRVDGWDTLYDLVQPDVVVHDHSPTALLSSFARPWPRTIVGTGFFIPPPLAPWPLLRRSEVRREILLAEELLTVECINSILAERDRRITSLSDLYDESTKLFLTFGELDHYGVRKGANYVGVWGNSTAVGRHEWPSCSTRRVFCYLKQSRELFPILDAVDRLGLSAIAYIDGYVPGSFPGSSIRFEAAPVNVSSIAKECDVAILNGNHATSAECLLNGIPILQVPLTLEQAIFSDRTVDLGAALRVDECSRDAITRSLLQLLSGSDFKNNALRFASMYASFDELQAIDESIGSIIRS